MFNLYLHLDPIGLIKDEMAADGISKHQCNFQVTSD